ncbi:hypothetical protein F4808DRAFT_198964 [Astrocystis sublimbata]|nr:hypothetical protein F4808DRAFT_198964 [Astrocystis sublimbata]
MTKQWDIHEATIKQLYAEKTLSEVRKIMIREYGFKASVRAYRGRLDKWGVRKYNCRRRSDADSASVASPASSTSGSDTASPTLSHHNTAGAGREPSPNPTSSHRRQSQYGQSNMSGRSYSNMETSPGQIDTAQYGRNAAYVSTTQQNQYGYSIPPAQIASPSTTLDHYVDASASMYGYYAMSPTSNTYPPAAYESAQNSHSTMQTNYQMMPTPQYNAGHNGRIYAPVQSHGHGSHSAGNDTYGAAHEHVNRHGARR